MRTTRLAERQDSDVALTAADWYRAVAAGVLALSLGMAGAVETGVPANAQRVDGIANYRCSACHGPTGQGENPMFPKLAGQNAEYLARQIMNFKSGARKGAVMFYQLGDLTADDITALAAYFSRQHLTPGQVRDPAMHAVGHGLYYVGKPANGVSACATCHGDKARGGGLMPRMAGQHAEYIAEQLYRFIDADRLPGQTQRHPGTLVLTHDEIRAVSLFLSALD